jgi:threonine/homoserine/homoserine lactone efflux protein
MKALKNVIVGFLVSFIGSVPLGYLNLIGFEIYSKSGIYSLIYYLIGIAFIEVFVIYFTLIFAKKMLQNKKVLKWIEIFSIVFLLILACTFFLKNENNNQNLLVKYISYSPFFIGIILSSLNFIQIPFWIGWNLYLVNEKYITVDNNLKIIYIIGTLLGTFFGMLCFVLFLNFVDANIDTNKFSICNFIPFLFLGMAVFQIYKFWKKYY